MTSHQLQLLFVDLALILLLARGLGQLAARIGQPPVTGEILAGILLGPSLLGSSLSGTLMPADVRPLLAGMASLGVALFMFGVGLEVEGRTLRGNGRVTVAVAVGASALPFLLGIGLAFVLLPGHGPGGGPGHGHGGGPVGGPVGGPGQGSGSVAAFVVFIGLAVSVTAFPVLARILADRGLSRTEVGGIALAAAAIVDVVAWMALAGVSASVGAASNHWQILLLAPYLLIMLFAVRPLLRRLLAPEPPAGQDQPEPQPQPQPEPQPRPLTPARFAAVLVGALLSAAATEAMGLHHIFGAFLFGAILPRDGTQALRKDLHDRTAHLTALLLPVYFAVAGAQVKLGGIGLTGLAELALILAVAVAGKTGGAYLGARSQKLPPRSAASLASLMNTRGLTELVVLGVGLELGLLDEPLYALFVVMALVTTMMTGPLLSLFPPPEHAAGRTPYPYPPGVRRRDRRDRVG
ncbi:MULTISPECIES: cation:proton antiporter [unclassified Streptomyces]|uniref:cation:proton antiporter domain-containing protein n=1 Tax=unclassified Streptomyces TaxID=2593676 RepID=UPI001BEB1D39|nr:MULTISPECIES: cation:proton antiporter [unclassified Streptomyces]MBT2402125.1 cation:proton antiporter [Streptomyces sp. ISL-21]MBT2609312.1 cation:proton antiporter [Streptomyces sp. ISL-87]